ncbi:maleylpyruvate isomerase family mycothiol-dependent enzyme [Solicola gregarius]|uniref:Maleylpyruvate isomerase family mycothiol-dependent enzyme n=1 Tax=Solicola gregarius TaxID=2908642 RepID=A0AA46THG1_9ACTN|nr:maleylpyruvate isomerase family mycothiol-dependent enzyme [Solicola gregarius]UYM05386.1 maleylpyruvate isomerase family mycothiol-dependent enzyme [Solicola gregarius]
MTTDSGIREAIVTERTELADILDGLDEEAWDHPSLCAGWRVREVVAHITMAFRYSLPRVALEMVKSRGRFDAMADRRARVDADELSVRELAAAVRDNIHHPWKPPGGGLAGALSHDTIHGLDITTPLGIDWKVPEERMRMIHRGMRPKNIAFFGVDLDDIELRADDMDWSYGTGEPVEGTAQDLLLVLCGRTLPPGRLRGAPSSRFTRG